MEIIWKQYPYLDLYEVSNTGMVRNIKTGNILKPQLRGGYCCLSLKDRMKSIHRMVAETFIDNPENKTTVNHKDGNKTNNFLSNLEWATHSEQARHAFDIGLVSKPLKEDRMLTDLEVDQICHFLKETNHTMQEIANYFNISISSVSDIRAGKRWSLGEIEREKQMRKGEDNGFSSLTDDQVKEIKEKLLRGERRLNLQNEYNVSKTTIQLIATGQMWKHIEVEGFMPTKVEQKRLSEDTKKEILDFYLLGNSLNKCSSKFDVSMMTARKIAIKAGKLREYFREEKQMENTVSRRFLDEKIVTNIKTDLLNGLTCRVISDKYELAMTTIQKIKKGDIWSEVKVDGFTEAQTDAKYTNKLTEGTVREIKYLLKNEIMRMVDICRKYNLSKTTLINIKTGRTWSNIVI